MDGLDVVLVAAAGERKEVLRELRRLTQRPIVELRSMLAHLPAVLLRGMSADVARELVHTAADVVKLAVHHPDGTEWKDPEPGKRPRRAPHREERAAAKRARGGVRFAVDPVAPSERRLATRSEREVWSSVIDGTVLHVAADRAVVASPGNVSPLLSAVQIAFDHHYPLRLTPDAIWLTIAAGFARHLDSNAESLRERFVRHEGRKTIAVRAGSEPWEALVDRFAEAVASEVGLGLRRLLTCDFSTSTPIDRCVSQVIFLSSFRRYFDYLAVGVCGIPEIELAGAVDDWRRIRERLEVFAEYGLEDWIAALRPIADEWVRTAEGEPDVAFWRAIYKPANAYGAQRATGWVTQLFPYLAHGERNPALDRDGRAKGFVYPGLALDQLPSGRVSASIRTEGGPISRSFELIAGLAASVQDDEGFVEPVSGWCVVDRPFSRILERIASDHAIVRAGGALAFDIRTSSYEKPAELIELYERAETASFFGGRWVIRRMRACDRRRIGVPVPGADWLDPVVYVFAELADGRCAGYCSVATRAGESMSLDWWVVLLGSDRVPTVDSPVIAKGIDTFLQRILDEGDRPFVDEPTFVHDGTFGDAIRATEAAFRERG